MDKKEYIERGALVESLKKQYGEELGWQCTVNMSDVGMMIEDAPAADVVSKGVYEQVQWERDMAMQQLEEHGIPFGGEADDVVNVVRCKDCKHAQNMPLGLCYLHTEPYDNARGYKGDAVCVEPYDFCSYGERKEQT